MEAYDQVVSEYYKERTHGVRTENWSQQIETFLGRKTRLDMLDELKSRIYSKIKENLDKYMSQASGDIFNTNVARSFYNCMS